MPHKATGPRTPEGKAISSRNAIRHGLTARQLLLPGEDPKQYEALRDSLVASHQPAAGLETVLVDQIAQCTWRLNRSRRAEAEALKEGLFGDDPVAAAKLDRITRYMTTVEREFHRAVKNLTTLQSTRAKAEAAQAQREEIRQKEQAREADARRKNEARERTAEIDRDIRKYLFDRRPDMYGGYTPTPEPQPVSRTNNLQNELLDPR